MREARQPINGLAASAVEYFRDVACPAISESISDPGSKSKALGACILAHHIADWASEVAAWEEIRADCPYSEALREIALGAKHFQVNNVEVIRAAATDGLRTRGYGTGPYGRGPYGPAIHTMAKRCPTADLEWTHVGEMLKLVRTWWADKLA
jgi:hypothetical protein